MGAERYSFDRLEREYGVGDASCKATFRFHLRDLRRLHAAMHFPDEIHTGHETVRGEEAFLIMLSFLLYHTRSATVTSRTRLQIRRRLLRAGPGTFLVR